MDDLAEGGSPYNCLLQLRFQQLDPLSDILAKLLPNRISQSTICWAALPLHEGEQLQALQLTDMSSTFPSSNRTWRCKS